jgi:2-phospho-L-lactate guanylyltransferase
MAGTLAILPIKRFELAKQRLREALSPQLRRSLAQAMMADVLATLAACEELAGILVVTCESRVSDLAREHGAQVAHDPAESGQSAAAMIGSAHALRDGSERVLLVPGDCPTLDGGELRELLAVRAPVTIVPDRHGTGTNALLLAPPDALRPHFGPGSFARHRDGAIAAGLAFEVREPPSLLLDVDTPDDFETMRRAPGIGPRTRALLDDA